MFADDAEKRLYEAWQGAHGAFVKSFAEANLSESLASLASLSGPIAAFFEAVMVMADDEAIRRNRLALLSLIAEDVKTFADYSKLAG